MESPSPEEPPSRGVADKFRLAAMGCLLMAIAVVVRAAWSVLRFSWSPWHILGTLSYGLEVVAAALLMRGLFRLSTRGRTSLFGVGWILMAAGAFAGLARFGIGSWAISVSDYRWKFLDGPLGRASDVDDWGWLLVGVGLLLKRHSITEAFGYKKSSAVLALALVTVFTAVSHAFIEGVSIIGFVALFIAFSRLRETAPMAEPFNIGRARLALLATVLLLMGAIYAISPIGEPTRHTNFNFDLSNNSTGAPYPHGTIRICWDVPNQYWDEEANRRVAQSIGQSWNRSGCQLNREHALYLYLPCGAPFHITAEVLDGSNKTGTFDLVACSNDQAAGKRVG